MRRALGLGVLFFAIASRAADGTDAAGTPPPAPKARPHHQAIARTPGQVIDDNVRRLTRALDLNSQQQSKLREILLDERRRMTELRTENLEPGADRVGMSVALVDQTKARIREILSDEQRQKYIVDVPREQTAPAQADLQHWMEVQESNRRAGGDSPSGGDESK